MRFEINFPANCARGMHHWMEDLLRELNEIAFHKTNMMQKHKYTKRERKTILL